MKLITKYKDTCIGIGMAIFTGFAYLNTLTIRDSGLTGTVNAASFPRWLCYGLWILSALLIIQDIRVQKNKTDEPEKKKKNDINYTTFILTAVVVTVYILLIRPLGFCPASALFLFAEFCVLSEKKERNYLLFAIVSVVAAVVIYAAFRLGLNLMLPRGIMPF